MQIVGIKSQALSSTNIDIEIGYCFVGTVSSNATEERTGTWKMTWTQTPEKTWTVNRWLFGDEVAGQSPAPLFRDVTESALGHLPSYRDQLRFGLDHWRSVLDGACGIDVYGNNGIAAGDFDEDGLGRFLYLSALGPAKPAVPNRGDGTFEDVTEKSGVGVLDAPPAPSLRILKTRDCRISGGMR